MTSFDTVLRVLEEAYIAKNYSYAENHLSETYVCHCESKTINKAQAVSMLRKYLKEHPVHSISFYDYSTDEEILCLRILTEYKEKEKLFGFTVSEKETVDVHFKKFRVENGMITESWSYWPEDEIKSKIPNYY